MGGEYIWCLHCNRTYLKGQFKRDLKAEEIYEKFFDDIEEANPLEMGDCPYPGCNGAIDGDGFDWDEVRKDHSDWPEIPVNGVIYEE